MSSTAPPHLPLPPLIGEENAGLSVYVHFPWCLSKCPYCDFLSLPVGTEGESADRAREARDALPHERYADAVLRELELRLDTVQHGHLRSIFIGGGTPSLWQARSLERVIQALLKTWGAGPDIEITAEANPSSLDAEQLAGFLEAGVNRLSVGVQSLDAQRLAFLGRLHSPSQALAAVTMALKSPIERVSADLIYGVAGQSADEAVQEATQVVELGVGHVSAYTLTIEPNTRFGELQRRGKLPLLDEGRVAESYAGVSAALETLGFEHYEISNFARPGQRSVHNEAYWRGQDYLGLGVGAVGTITPRDKTLSRLRYKNPSSVAKYFSLLEAPRKGPFEFAELDPKLEPISPETAISESLLLGLRTSEGVDLALEGQRRGRDPWTVDRKRAIDRFSSRGWLEVDASRIRIPKAHWIVADRVIRDLI
jgi:putative oxygen-independent coproporphyrinogen III oxidase